MAVHPREPRPNAQAHQPDSRIETSRSRTELPSRGSPESEDLSPTAFADLLGASSGTLWTIAVAVLGEPSEAEDVLQEAALAALGKLDEFKSGTSFVAWMGSFVRNHARNWARKRQRRATHPLESELIEHLVGEVDQRNGRRVSLPVEELHGRPVLALGGESTGELPADLEAFDDVLLLALSSLSEEARAALLLRVVNGLSYAELGLAMGIPEGTAASHVHRARTQLRLLLEAQTVRGEAESQPIKKGKQS